MTSSQTPKTLVHEHRVSNVVTSLNFSSDAARNLFPE